MKKFLGLLIALILLTGTLSGFAVMASELGTVTFTNDAGKTVDALDFIDRVTANVSFVAATTGTAKVIAAHYTADGVLSAMEFINPVETVTGEPVTYTTPEILVTNTDLLKVFAWSGTDTLVPLTTPGMIIRNQSEEPVSHFETKFVNHKKYLYRVGDDNAVALGSLFRAAEGAEIDSAAVTLEVSAFSREGEVATYTPNTTDWTKGTILFSESGFVTVTISDETSEPFTLNLEVVDGTNVTSAQSVTDKNIILLNDCGFGQLNIKNGYTLFGNGFKLVCSGDAPSLNMSYAFLMMEGGTLDNVQLITPHFSHGKLYHSNLTEDPTAPQYEASTGKTRYYNTRSAIMAIGNNKILNSYVQGGRAAIYASEGEVLLDNTTVVGGAGANIHMGPSVHLTLRDATLFQKPFTATVNDTSKTLMGMSVFATGDTEGNVPAVTLEGTLKQYAWACEDYSTYVPDAGQQMVGNAISKTNFIHQITYPDGVTRDSLNLGFAFIPDGLDAPITAEGVAARITDNRTNKDQVPYEVVDVSGAKIYSYKNTNGTHESFQNEPTYQPNEQGVLMPTLVYADEGEAVSFETLYNTTDGWHSILSINLDTAPGYTFSFDQLVALKYGEPLEYTVKDASGNPVEKTDITFTEAIQNQYTLVITDPLIYDGDGQPTGAVRISEYPFILKSTQSDIPEPTISGLGNGNYYRLVANTGGDWRPAYNAFSGVSVNYWSQTQGEVVDLALSDIPYGEGTISANTWTYTCDDYTLKLEGGAVHSDGTKITPVWAEDSLYYVSTNKAFGTGTTARTIVITYTFTDSKNNSASSGLNKTITFSGLTEYDYTEFKNNGTLKEATKGNTCLAEGTLITMADGSKRAVEDMRKGDKVMAFDHLSGTLTESEVIIVVKTESEFFKNTFVFDDGTSLSTINEHGIFDLEQNRYVNIDHLNKADYIGHRFVSVDVFGNIGTKVLTDVISEYESGYKYDIVTNQTLNYIAEDTLSITHVLVDVANGFDFGEHLTYDAQKMATDIETYGLYTYDEWEPYCDMSVFCQYNIPAMKVGISKGLYTKEYIIGLINTYVLDDSVQIID